MADRVAPQRNERGTIIGTGRTAQESTAETERQKREAQHAPWRARWEKETGKKYGIATKAEYTAWLRKQREKMAKKKASGQTARKQGDALAPEKKD